LARCSPADVRSKVFTKATDLQISGIISDVDDEVSTLAGSTNQSDPNLIQACKWASRADTVRYMMTNGEMPVNVKYGNSQQQNAPDQLIKAYDEKADAYIQKYKTSSVSFSIPSGRMGHGTINNTEGFP
jgi:hypothetical protein